MRFLCALLLVLSALCRTPLAAEEVAVLVDDSKPGFYLVEVKSDRTVVANPTKVTRPGGTTTPTIPTNPTDPTNPVPTTLVQKAQQLTEQAIASGGTTDTAGLLALGYSAVGAEIANGIVAPANAADRLKVVTDTILQFRGDGDKWVAWRAGMGDLLSPRVGTKDQWVSTLKDLSQGTKEAAESVGAANGKAVNWELLLSLLRIILELIANRTPQ